MLSGAEFQNGDAITFRNVNRHHSGVYYCEAHNGFYAPSEEGKNNVAAIKLDVQHAPTVEQEQTFIHTREDDETEVVCIVHASPKAKVEWFKNGKPLKSEDGMVKVTQKRKKSFFYEAPFFSFTGDHRPT